MSRKRKGPSDALVVQGQALVIRLFFRLNSIVESLVGTVKARY